MKQDSFWNAAPEPVGISLVFRRMPEREESTVTVVLSWSKNMDPRPGDYTQMTIEPDEEDVVPYLFHSAFQAWNTTNPRLYVPSETRGHLESYRNAAASALTPANRFRSIDFG